MTVTLGDFSVEQFFIVVEKLSTPVILGCNYLTDNGFVLHFKLGTFHRAETPNQKLKLLPAEAIPCHLITVDNDCPQQAHTQTLKWVGSFFEKLDLSSNFCRALALN